MALNDKPNILVLVDWFHPGYKAGGPIRSCVNFSYAMKEDYNIWVLTSDRDHGVDTPYEDIITDRWVDFDVGIKVMYVSQKSKGVRFISNTIKKLKPDYIYINVVFSVFYSIVPLLSKVFGLVDSRFIICPRGVFNQHGISSKTFKKKSFIKIMRLIGGFNKVTFHATTPLEQQDIQKLLGADRKIFTVSNFPQSKRSPFSPREKEENRLSLVYIARIHPIKNLLFFLKVLEKFQKNIVFSIYGPIEDKAYWEKCKSIISKLSHTVTYNGELKHVEVASTLEKFDFMVLPTTGENFGHSIFESFIQSRPVLIANTTPWRDLSTKKVGWDLSIEEDSAFLNALTLAYKMGPLIYREWCLASWNLANNIIEEPSTMETYKKIFSNDEGG